ncbi:hypothetical protein COF68_06235 [Bacillus toyonensis]|uniref:hypothetical protein n=1 Tax=Bacillus toyonensis TaxID=155322 RepID=UPI000BFE61ED|nr:hypothetical protein [Bacillus toyonensis]PHE64432.1 hypothetical protein COF68_06235 [Bacillus toyonensis]
MGDLIDASTLFNLLILLIQVVIVILIFRPKTKRSLKSYTGFVTLTVVEYIFVMGILTLFDGNYYLEIIGVCLVNNIVLLLYLTMTTHFNFNGDKEFMVYRGLLLSLWVLGNIVYIAIFIKTI